MWVPQQLPEISGPLKAAGLKLTPKQLSDLTGDPLGAIVSLGGCTASFVSPQGLVTTNHHCAYGAIQLNSTAQKNLIKDGFNAATQAEELTAGPNARVFVLDRIDDVTPQVRQTIMAAPDALARSRARDTIEKRLVADCEAVPGYRCQFYSFAGGASYRLFRNLEIKDVRLVYAPPNSIGNYGGEVDNWMWPRHTGDFAFYRAYVGRDGKPAAYSPDNVPYRPKQWLKIADKPLAAGDFVMVAGYPGSTNRYALAGEFDNTADWTYPTVSRHNKAMVAMVDAEGKKTPDIAVKYASIVRGWENTLKNYDGQLEGFQRMDASGIKAKQEEAVLTWLRKRNKAGMPPALEAYETLRSLLAQTVATRERDLVLARLGSNGVLSTAVQLYRLSIERAKADADREPGYQQRDYAGIEGGLRQMERRYHPTMDRELMRYWLGQYVHLPKEQRLQAMDAWLKGSDDKAIASALKSLGGSKLGNTDERLRWLNADRKAFETSKDPAIRYAVAMMPTLLRLEEARKSRAGDSMVARPIFLQAVAEYKKSRGEAVYPDANGSLRITFGNVTGYLKRDGSKQLPFTRLEEVAQKATGQEPFDAPQAQLDAIRGKRYGGLADAKLGTVPVNFLSDLDITGGNSGSPVLDAQGKLVGLAFDGNWESVSSNWVYDDTVNRMISLDQRYMRWIMQEVFPAPQLLQELGVPAKK
ncbi:MAG: S46 family peptidase [Lysobacteraceae bacterium]